MNSLNNLRCISIKVVCDVTGSMSPYTSQVLLWQKLHYQALPNHIFCFFNDGNTTPDAQKVMGKVGGVYVGDCDNFDEVKSLCYRAMTSGGGGDCPENNVEAVIKT
ncbi:hypothetical protein GC194_13530, partial [bacterium]|nr:hypothetical protein [bacterium]